MIKGALLSLILVSVACFSSPALSAPSCAALFSSNGGVSPINQSFLARNKSKIIKLSYQVPLSIALSMMIWKQVDQRYFWPAAEATVASHAIDVTNKNASFYDNLIANDFRYKEIRLLTYDAKAQELDPRLSNLAVQKRILAHTAFQNYAAYYESIKNKNPLELTAHENLTEYKNTPLFKHLNIFLDNGVFELEGTTVKKEHLGSLTDLQKKKIFDETHKLYISYFLLESFRNKQSSANAQLFQTDYAQALAALKESKKLTEDELYFYIQEDLYNQYSLNLLASLNIHFKRVPETTADPYLTIEDLRAERLGSLQNRQKHY